MSSAGATSSIVMGALGIVDGRWSGSRRSTGRRTIPAINEAEFDYIKDGGALVDMDAAKDAKARRQRAELGPYQAAARATA